MTRLSALYIAVAVIALAAAGVCADAAPATRMGYVVVTDYVAADGKTDAADAIQRLIDANPNRTLWFPDGTYLLSKPICTPAAPRLSVDLQLSNYAILKAAPGWTNTEAMVRLGGIHPANDIDTPGSVYSLTGGIIDGSGVAKGVSIDSGRETRVRLVSMKNVLVGLHIKAEGLPSDADIADVHIQGNGSRNSIGVLIETNDNTLSNMRIVHVNTGVKLVGGGNLLTNVHPLFNGSDGPYANTAGFADYDNNNSYNRCYSDHFSTGWFFGAKSKIAYMDGCMCYWYAKTPGERQTAIRCEKRYNALSSKMWIGFTGKDGQTNSVICVGEAGGLGVLEDPHLNEGAVNEVERSYLQYLRGGVH
ncbi:MAG: hypothetical protein IJS36_06260 [Kiritimatiellae bacterium]|nr:hypothetical protein [Kiritimatiellia bacterium]